MITSIKIWEAGLAGEPLGMAALLGISLGTCMCLLPAPGLLLCPVIPTMRTLNIFTFPLTYSGRNGLRAPRPGWRAEFSQGQIFWQLQPLTMRKGKSSSSEAAVLIQKVLRKHHGRGS